jgi:hypothetical protein
VLSGLAFFLFLHHGKKDLTHAAGARYPNGRQDGAFTGKLLERASKQLPRSGLLDENAPSGLLSSSSSSSFSGFRRGVRAAGGNLRLLCSQSVPTTSPCCPTNCVGIAGCPAARRRRSSRRAAPPQSPEWGSEETHSFLSFFFRFCESNSSGYNPREGTRYFLPRSFGRVWEGLGRVLTPAGCNRTR